MTFLIVIVAWILVVVAASMYVFCIDRRPRRCTACERSLRWEASCDGPIDMWNERADCSCGETTWWGP